MPTMIAVITRDEIANPTMALPFLDTFLVPQIPERKMTQQTLVFKQKSAPTTHVLRTVNSHFCDNNVVATHMCKVKCKKQRNKKESKTNNSKKKTGTAKHGAFAKLDDNCKNKGDTQFAQSNHLQQLMNLARGIEN
jgi:hypothetical protein